MISKINIIPAILVGVVATCIGFKIFFIQSRVVRAKSKSSSRDELKNGFSEAKMKTVGDVDVIIIGSGIAGLTSGSLLSRIGYKVLILEGHDVIGGCTHVFNSKGYEFDTGLHYIGGSVGSKWSIIGFLFHMLSRGELKWAKMDSKFDNITISSTLQSQISKINHKSTSNLQSSTSSHIIIHGSENFEKDLIDAFPNESQNIVKYFQLIKNSKYAIIFLTILKLLPQIISNNIQSLINSIFIHPYTNISTKDILDSYFNNMNLKGYLSYCWGDYGLPPYQSSFLMNAVLTDHFSGGAYYPIGGSSRIAQTFIRNITANRATGSSVLGVNVRGHFIPCHRVISTVGLVPTFLSLIPMTSPPDPCCAYANEVRSHFSQDIYNSYEMSGTHPVDLEEEMTNSTSTSMSTTLERNMLSSNINDSCESNRTNVVDSLECDANSNTKGLEGVTATATNYWCFPHLDHDSAYKMYLDRKRMGVTDMTFPLVFISSSSAKDPDYSRRNPGKSVFEILTVVDYDAFVTLVPLQKRNKPLHRGKQYEATKKMIENRLLLVFQEIFPHLMDKIRHVESGTPLTNNFYLGKMFGEVYGISHDLPRFNCNIQRFLHPQQGIKGLFLSGQDIFIDGVCGAMTSGIITAISIDCNVCLDFIWHALTIWWI
eukprot:gene5000-10006_t